MILPAPEDSAPVLKPVPPLELFKQQAFFMPPELSLVGESLYWIGRENDAVVYRALTSEGQETRVSVFSLISEDEKIIFRAFQDWYAGALRQVSAVVRGYYTFEVLQFFVGDAPRNWAEFSDLLIRHASKQLVSERRLIQFGSLWGVLERHTEADFGRVESKLRTDFFKPQPESFARKLSKILTKRKITGAGFVIFKDESAHSLLRSSEWFELFLKAIRQSGHERNEAAFLWHPSSKACLRI